MSKLRSLGYNGPHRSGKHHFMLKGDFRLTIPNPHRQDIGIPLLKEIINRAGITREEWLRADKE
ncbi:MAG: type II toxin-antitoxin system HicA family toxin [Chloroflexota bacterium]